MGWLYLMIIPINAIFQLRFEGPATHSPPVIVIPLLAEKIHSIFGVSHPQLEVEINLKRSSMLFNSMFGLMHITQTDNTKVVCLIF